MILNTGLNSHQKWQVGNDIREMLLADASIEEAVGQNIFPVVAPQETLGDFIIYKREKYSKSWTKMGVVEDDCQVSITVVSDDYDNATALASMIDNCLTGQHINKDNTVRLNIDLVDSTEDYEGNKYIEVLLFRIR